MSAIRQALSYLNTDISPSITSPTSAQSFSSENQSPNIRRPIEDSASYFPEDSTDGSGRSSLSDDNSEHSRPQQLQRTQTGNNPLEAMSRNYAAPTEELDIAKQLELEPQKRSLHDSLKRNATFERARKVDDAETKAKKLAAAKAELRAMAGTI
jgi:hypothetical protein